MRREQLLSSAHLASNLDCVKIHVMKKGEKTNFLQPRLANILLSFFVLCLPLLREQYNNGEYVTWYRPIVLIASYFQKPGDMKILFLIISFLLIVYFVVSLIIFILTTIWKRIYKLKS